MIESLKMVLFLFLSVIPGVITHVITRLICKKIGKKFDNSLFLIFYALIPISVWAATFFVAAEAPTKVETNTYDLVCIDGTNTANMHWSSSQQGQIYFYYNDGTEDMTLRSVASKGNIVPSNTSENTVIVTTYIYENKFLDFFLGTLDGYMVFLSDESLLHVFNADYLETS